MAFSFEPRLCTFRGPFMHFYFTVNMTEQLKAENQMLWVKRMNNIRNRATEIVNAELIYV